jgi:hypothetical protein
MRCLIELPMEFDDLEGLLGTHGKDCADAGCVWRLSRVKS